ncbi:glycosyltransferase family 2 protein [Paenibacillus melissococcoides]|uniref:Glycosyltransferase family 2 protein n=2 Tax=Paenibacillus TaxID=44249 RepID=A0ABM9FV68_9BACL|nr:MULTISPECIES: glycosyltransferase family 2 protein [Paenibacillus]MEB9892227.1 glycosyltransferase family 2 protein [Bacillus cereus]CAH8243034.1 glycosyltransferase family 2 protein [Paenibacillus melissococcoides]CAH8703622.1 glycosyltransferase family 2 protein [Paenibacillus melissococcoides]CAH8706595.1 glycosyltransferase family 2 protein [Paenibacillus melissococcoides]
MTPILYMVVPCYNEEAVLPLTMQTLTGVLSRLVQDCVISAESRILLVDDGSRDATWLTIVQERERNHWIAGLKLSRNAGHQKALLAGLMYAKNFADCVVSLDADLQDDVAVVRQFVEQFRDGCDIVYGVRDNRDNDTYFKRWSAEFFYKLMRRMGIPLVYNHADYRLMSRRVLDYLSQFPESNLFLRGIVPLIGFPSSVVPYRRMERAAGETKYPLRKMLSFAWDGITSFSMKPMRVVTALGFVSLGASALAGLYALLSKLLGQTVSGWTSLMLSVWFVGSVQLLGLGVVGEYIGKIYSEVKRRPPYIIEQVLADKPVIEQPVRAYGTGWAE